MPSHEHTKGTTIFRAIPPDKQMRDNQTASAHTQKKDKRKTSLRRLGYCTSS